MHRFIKPILSFVSLLWLAFLGLQQARAQAPAWQSARAVAIPRFGTGTTDYSTVTATAVDAAGNVFLAGHFTNSVVFGGTNLTSFGSYDVFVAKFNPASNQIVWAMQAGGQNNDQALALAVSGNSVYVTGRFASGTASFGPTTLTNAGGGNDAFVAKLTDAGSTATWAWAQRMGGTSNEYASAVAVSGSSVYVGGAFSGSMASFGATALTSAGFDDLFVAKLTDAGSTSSFGWVQGVGGTGNDQVTALAASGSSVYVAGNFNSPTLGFGTITLTTAGLADVFVAKLADAGATGSFTWAQRAGGTRFDYATALAVSGSSVYVAGNFDSPTADFGAVALTIPSGRDVFVARLDDAGSTGSFGWAQQTAANDSRTITALAVRGLNVYLAGSFGSNTVAFGATTLLNAGRLTGTEDVFVAKLANVGGAGTTASFAWALRAGGTSDDQAASLALSGTSVYVAGYLRSDPADFGPTTLSTSFDIHLGFLAGLTDPTLTTAKAAGRALAPAQLFPNPATATATVLVPAVPGCAEVKVVLLDGLGRVVLTHTAALPAIGAALLLNVAGLARGVYTVRLAAGGTTAIRRLVLE